MDAEHENNEQLAPSEIADQLERDIQTLNRRCARNFMRGDSTPREILTEHYTSIRGLCDDAIRELKGEDADS